MMPDSYQMFAFIISMIVMFVILTLTGALILFLTARVLKVPNVRYFPSLGVVVCSSLVKAVIVLILALILILLFNDINFIVQMILSEVTTILTMTLFVMLFLHVDKVKAFLVGLTYTIVCDVLAILTGLFIIHIFFPAMEVSKYY